MGLPDYQDDMQKKVAKSGRRKLVARQNRRSIWYGLGMFGMIGWSVAVPTVAGTFLGLWLDQRIDRPFSCTLMGLFAGLVSGVWIAWYWVCREGLVEDTELDPIDADEENLKGKE